jgi:hypothetical protein
MMEIIVAEVLDESATYFFGIFLQYTEDEGRKCLRNIRKYLPACTASYSRTQVETVASKFLLTASSNWLVYTSTLSMEVITSSETLLDFHSDCKALYPRTQNCYYSTSTVEQGF